MVLAWESPLDIPRSHIWHRMRMKEYEMSCSNQFMSLSIKETNQVQFNPINRWRVVMRPPIASARGIFGPHADEAHITRTREGKKRKEWRREREKKSLPTITVASWFVVSLGESYTIREINSTPTNDVSIICPRLSIGGHYGIEPWQISWVPSVSIGPIRTIHFGIVIQTKSLLSQDGK